MLKKGWKAGETFLQELRAKGRKVKRGEKSKGMEQ